MKAIMPIGPFDPVLRIPLNVKCEIDGGMVTSASVEEIAPSVEAGPAYEGISLEEGAVLASHTCARSAVHHAAAFCEAVEGAHGIEVPASHAAMRVVLSEWTRIASHLEVVSDVGRAVADDLVCARPRRHLFYIRSALNEACGNPFGFGTVVPGGVRLAGDPGRLDRLGDSMRALERDCGFLAWRTGISRSRLSAKGLRRGDLPETHPPAPAFRASGSRGDLRCGGDAHGFYAGLDCAPVTREGGTALDRVLVLLGEIVSSIAIIGKARAAAREPDRPLEEFSSGKGSSSGAWESPHGALEYRVLSGSGGRIIRVRAFGAARDVAGLAPGALSGTPFEDAAASIVSLNLCNRCMGA